MNKKRKLFLLSIVYFNLLGLTCACVTPGKMTKSGRNNSLPDYYETYIESIAGRINQIVKKNSSEADGFFFITDTHVGSNALNGGKILRILQEKTQVKKVVWGGDAITAFGTREELEEQINIQDNYLKKCGEYGILLSVRGNHDYLIMNSGSNMVNGYIYQEALTNMHLRKMNNKDVVYDETPGAYYYYDNKKANIRYIVLSTTESLGEGSNVAAYARDGIKNNGGTEGMHRQWNWLFTKALNTDKNVVIISHIPISLVCSGSGNENYELRQALRAYKKRGKYGDHDFSNATANIVACIAGHAHVDSQEMNDGILFVTTSCDSYPNDDASTKNVAIDIVTDKRGSGSVKEQLMDYYNIDLGNNIISTLRIGGGKDRYFHTQTINLEIGEKCNLIPKYINAVSWKSYNEGNHDNSNDVWPTWSNGERNLVLPNDRVSVNNGIVTALKAGGANVVAISDDNVIELFYIKID